MASGLTFNPDIPTFAGLRSKFIYTALSGGNNSGKSAVLKNIKQHLGHTAYLVLPMRFYHIHQISSMQHDPNELQQLEQQFQNSFHQPEVNHEQNFLDLGRVISNLSNDERIKLFEVCGNLIGSKFSLKRVDPNNELSMSYVDMDGQNLGLGSTGTRLLMTLIGICMDKRFNTILIDEPELGLSPKVQEAFANFLQDDKKRTEMFPHLSAVYVATHSHLFLDKAEPPNNYIVSRNNAVVEISNISTVSELHRLQFNLLGNSLETISLPAAIVVTEGPSDFDFLKRVIEQKFPNKRITVVSGLGDVKKKVNSIKEMLGGDLQKSPYRDRLFVVVDSIHPQGLAEQLKTMGVQENNLVVWSRNGIEYLYPSEIMAQVFNTSIANITEEVNINNDEVTIRDITLRKVELAQTVVSKLNENTSLPEELTSKLIDPLSSAVE